MVLTSTFSDVIAISCHGIPSRGCSGFWPKRTSDGQQRRSTAAIAVGPFSAVKQELT
jgi:hypothetical protein